jgi:hypothetical protein
MSLKSRASHRLSGCVKDDPRASQRTVCRDGRANRKGGQSNRSLSGHMLKSRVIPCLDVKDGRVVKGVNFVDLIDAGDPVEAAQAYDAAGADELCFLDITASSDNRDTIFDVVAQTAEHCFMPLTVGGGVRTVADIRKLLLSGADKVSINSAAVRNPDFVAEAADKFGNQCIVVSIDAKKVSAPGEADRWEIFTHGGRSRRGSMPSPSQKRWWSVAPAKFCSPRWIATEPKRAMIFR